MSIPEIRAILQKVREGTPITSDEVMTVTSNSVMTRGRLKYVAAYMRELEALITWCTQDGIMSDARSLADAGCHHQHGEELMQNFAIEMGLASRPRRRPRMGNNINTTHTVKRKK